MADAFLQQYPVVVMGPGLRRDDDELMVPLGRRQTIAAMMPAKIKETS
jgi:hypothetical protein